MPRRLSALKIREVSSVDRGAGEGVRVLLTKRAPLTPEQAEAAVETYMKREFSGKERKRLAASGAAMPDGGFPIADVEDLENAIRAIGRAKDPAATKKHIIARARSLGASDKIPEDWRSATDKLLAKALGDMAEAVLNSDGGDEFEPELATMLALDFGEDAAPAVTDACEAMQVSAESIAEDDAAVDKAAALRDSFGQFLDHVQTIAPKGDVEKAWKGIAKRCRAVILSKRKDNPMEITLEKAMEKIAKLETQAAANDALIDRVVKMSAAHRAYMGHADNDMSDDAKKKFAGMSDEERDAHMEKHPVSKMTEKRMENLPEPLRKQLEEGRASAEKLAKFEAERETEVFGKRAADFGLPVEIGKHFAVIANAAPEAWAVVEKALNTLANRSDMAVLFKEFGTSQGGAVGTALDQLNEKAAELRKTQPALTEAMAFEKVYTDPSNRELVTMEKRERMGIAAAA